MAKYISTKTYKQIGPVAYRQWRADSHCNLIHGYALSFHFEFECDTLDARNWTHVQATTLRRTPPTISMGVVSI